VLLACIQPKHADAQSAVAATAAHNCSLIKAASRHRYSGFRTLSAVQASKGMRYCITAHKSVSVLNFYTHRGRWAVAPRYHKWWQVPGAVYRKIVRKNRMIVRLHQDRLLRLNAKIEDLLPEPQVAHDWLYDALLCIHGGEGSWDSNTGNGYYGGLQMDGDFMRSYGAEFLAQWGTADKWPVWAQLVAAENAYRAGRGFNPWPNTARDCGLL
jgi:hypothetical protein